MKDFEFERISNKPIEVKGETSVLHGFKLNRMAEGGFAMDMKEADENWTFYEKGTGNAKEMVMARRTAEDLVEVIYPFCKDLVKSLYI